MTTYLVDIINQFLPEPHASLLAGMVLGVKRTMPADFYNDLLRTGTVHVIALSGMNISIITRVLFSFVAGFMGKWLSVGLTLLGICGFVLLVGPSPTIVRASLMGSLTMLALVLGRKDVPLISLCVVSIGMVLFDFSILTNISFQLSFLATLGILLFAGINNSPMIDHQQMSDKSHSSKLNESDHIVKPSVIGKFLSLTLHWVWTELRVTLAAQAFTVPLILFHFRQISFVSPLANIMVGWLVPMIMYMGFIMLALSLLFRPLGYLVALLLWVPLTIFITLISWISRLPFASLQF